ncbi:MAG: MotA/TolQ/ExbB proton channel family protein [Planctomycetes bacterium]|nr:MotA/TolQ/ExbB proton channel family protein [Planctomycetota bacterium]
MFTRVATFVFLIAFAASSAWADEIAPEAVFATFQRGGKLMWAILAASMIGCVFIVERLLVVRRSKQIPKRLMANLREAMVAGGVQAGLRVVEHDKSAMGRVMFALLSRSGATRRELENTVDDEASRILLNLRANLRPIGVMATVSPQLGLLGTVFGLIAAFRAAAELGMDDPRNFAAGIYEALYTTAFGLVVAIPLLIAYHLLRNHCDSIMREVEARALAFISVASSRSGSTRPEAAVRGRGEQEQYANPNRAAEAEAAAASAGPVAARVDEEQFDDAVIDAERDDGILAESEETSVDGEFSDGMPQRV